MKFALPALVTFAYACRQEFPTSWRSTAFDVYVQDVPLLADKVGKVPPELLHLIHTGLYFAGNTDNEGWTLEYDAYVVMMALFPTYSDGVITVGNGSEVRYCGFAGKDPFHTSMKLIARITGSQFNEVMGFIKPRTQFKKYWYQTFLAVNASDGKESTSALYDPNGAIPFSDNTCGQGALAMIDFMNETLKIPLVNYSSAAEVPFTSATLLVEEWVPIKVDINNVTDPDVRAFYEKVSYSETGSDAHLKAWRLFRSLETRWKVLHVRTPQGDQFFKLRTRFPHLEFRHRARADWRNPIGPGGEFDPVPGTLAAPEFIVV